MARQLLEMASMTVVAGARHWLHMPRMPLDLYVGLVYLRAYSSRAPTSILVSCTYEHTRLVHLRAYSSCAPTSTLADMLTYIPHMSEIDGCRVKY